MNTIILWLMIIFSIFGVLCFLMIITFILGHFITEDEEKRVMKKYKKKRKLQYKMIYGGKNGKD